MAGMKGNGPRILFISPVDRFEFTEIPLGLISIATHVRDNLPGTEVMVFDKRPEELKKAISRFSPDIIGIYSTVVHLKIIKQYIRIIRRHSPNSRIVLGGPTTISSLENLKELKPDAIIIGEGETRFLRYAESFSYIRNDQDNDHTRFHDRDYVPKSMKNISNIVYRISRNGKEAFITNNDDGKFEDLSRISLPDLSLIDFEKYVKRFYYFDYIKDVRGIQMIVSRGCSFNCSFCQPTLKRIFGNRIRRYSTGKIIDYIIGLKKRYHINSVFFHDDTFTTDKEWTRGFCQELIKRKVGIRWGCNSRVDTIDDRTIRLMKRAGCVEIRLGIESFNERSLRFLNKNIDNRKTSRAIEIIKNNRIRAFAFIIIGCPEESVMDILGSLVRLTLSRVDITRISILTNIPGTYLDEKIKTKSDNPEYFNYIKDSRNNCSSIPYPVLDLLRKAGYAMFYLNPKRWITTFQMMNSIGKIKSKLERL